MDVCDEADLLIEGELNLARKQLAGQKTLEAKGCCHFCDEVFEASSDEHAAHRKFCDEDCRKGYEKEQRMRHITGA